jgi:hypothetical protein
MEPLRDAPSRVRATAPEFDEARALQHAIDRFAGVLTGDPEYFRSLSAQFEHSVGVIAAVF